MHLKRLCGNLLPLLVATSVGLAVTAKAAEEKASPEHQPSGAPSSVRQMQQDFLKLKFGMFIHFNLETFKGVQWVAGYHSPADFNPGGKIDTDAWADAAVSAGMKYAVKEMRHFPKAWATGSVRGMRVRGGYAVDMEWKDGVLTQAVLRGISNDPGKVEARYGKGISTFTLAKGDSRVLRAGDFGAEK